MSKKVLIIAGPNGAGKTTLANELFENSTDLYEFINADEIARGLAPRHPESMALTASKLMIKRLKDMLEQNQSFAFRIHACRQELFKSLKRCQIKRL